MTPSKEDYLKAIWSLSERRTGQPPEVSTKDLAETLQISLPAVSKMLKQMNAQALVVHNPYYGVRLSDRGRAVALKIVRRHRLLEKFLAEVLHYPLSAVHDEAERLEHYISDELEFRVYELLGHPQTCPHGSPIPSFDEPIAITNALSN